jgi:hypothetical protein
VSLHGDFRSVADGCYQLTFAGEGIQFDVKRLRWERGDLFGLLTVRCDLAGASTVDRTLSMGTFNLTSVSGRSSRAKELDTAAAAPEIPFRLMLEELCQKVILAEQAGQPVILLRHVEPQPLDSRVVSFHGLPIPIRHPTIASALGGTGKTTIAMSICGELERRGIPTLYLDYETNEYDCRTVAERLFGPEFAELDLKYRRCERPLYLEAESIAHQVDQCGIQFVIVDSAGYACDGRPEDAEVALRYFRALRQLRVGSWTNAHISSGEHGTEKPFGSVFWFNSARTVWYFEKSALPSLPDTMTIGAYCRKNNLGRLHSAIGLQVQFGPAGTTVAATDIAEDDQLATKLPVSARIAHLLKSGPQTIARLAEELGAKVDTVEKSLRRGEGKSFIRVTAENGVFHWALLDRRVAA